MLIRFFLDSNVFVCADGHLYPAKQKIAADLFGRARAIALGVVSTQVVQEYYSADISKLKAPPDVARLSVVPVESPINLAAFVEDDSSLAVGETVVDRSTLS